MSLFSKISDFFQSGDQGENWAERIWEHNLDVEEGKKEGDIIEPDEDFVEELAEEYSKDPDSFYAGFEVEWNERVKESEREESAFGRFLNWAGF